MSKVRMQAHTGDPSEGNPYDGDRGMGIDYDSAECELEIVDQEGDFPVVRTAYRSVASKLVRYLNPKVGDVVVDLGSGTGIATLELLTQHPQIGRVIGVDKSPGMLEVAKYKFHND